MANIKNAYGTQNQAFTITLNSLANGSYRQSTVVDNTSNNFLDYLVSLIIKSGASGVSSTGTIVVYAYATTDGTNYTDGASGTDGAMTPTSPSNLIYLGTINVVANAVTYYGGPFSIAAAFGGQIPEKFGIVVYNNTGAALNSTTNSANYQGVYATSV